MAASAGVACAVYWCPKRVLAVEKRRFDSVKEEEHGIEGVFWREMVDYMGVGGCGCMQAGATTVEKRV